MGPVGVGTGTGVVVVVGRRVVDTPETPLGAEEPETVLGKAVLADVPEPDMTAEDAMEVELEELEGLEELEELEQGIESHPGVYLFVS